MHRGNSSITQKNTIPCLSLGVPDEVAENIYSILAVKICIYGGQSLLVGVKPRTRPLRLKVQALKKYFEDKYTKKMAGVTGCEIFLTHLLIDSSYMDELPNNFISIVRHIGTYITGDEKLLRSFGESDNVCVVFSKSPIE